MSQATKTVRDQRVPGRGKAHIKEDLSLGGQDK
jgi:hypothetical protein